jgi:hypothetical protein
MTGRHPRRPTFVLRLRSERGEDIHALRAILKAMLRRHGFRCIEVREDGGAVADLAEHWAARSARRQRLVAHLHAAGARPTFEALLEVAAGRDLDAVLERFARIPPAIYRDIGADTLAIDTWAVIEGGQR